MKKVILLTLAFALIVATHAALANGPTTTVNYGDAPLSVTSSGSAWVVDSGHFEDIWDLTQGDITISFTYDANGLEDTFGGNAHAWAELGVRTLGLTDFNPTSITVCDEESFDLMADQDIDVGDVIVQKVGDYLYVKYVITEPGWVMTATHVAVGDDPEYIPQKKGNPIPGQFDYKEVHDPPVTEYQYPPIDISGFTSPYYVATHALVVSAIEDCYEQVWQIGEEEEATCGGDLTNYANEFNWKEFDGSAYTLPVGDCVNGPTLAQNEPAFTDPFIVGTTPIDQFPYNSNYGRGYATDFDVQWTGGLPLGGKLTVSWSPGQSASERKEISGDGISSTIFTATGTSSPGEGYFLNLYPLGEDYADVDPLANGTHTIRFQHNQGDGTFWDWIRLEKPCEQWETAWGGDHTFPGKNWATYIEYEPTCSTVSSGVWLATDYNWCQDTFSSTIAHIGGECTPYPEPLQDLDDKLILQKVGGQGEAAYDLFLIWGSGDPYVPPPDVNPWANHAVSFDRDGVDIWQATMWGTIDGVTYNTSGTYEVVIYLHATSNTAGKAFITVNGEPQGFYAPNWHSGPADAIGGMTFTADMKQLQVFYGLGGYAETGTTHSVTFEDITVEQ